MGAEVIGGGHACSLFKSEYIKSAPQVHIHFLTDDDEYQREGQGKVELVCHGCGEALLLLYDTSGSRRRFMAVRNQFRDKHQACPNRGYEKSCPDYRRATQTMDVRRAVTISRKSTQAA